MHYLRSFGPSRVYVPSDSAPFPLIPVPRVDMPGPQQLLDETGEWVIPVTPLPPPNDKIKFGGEIQLPNTLFLPSYSRVTGHGFGRSKINSFACGTAFVPGWARGLIDDSHYAGGVFRTKADCWAVDCGGQFQFGKFNGAGNLIGWADVSSFRFQAALTKNYSGNWTAGSAVAVAGLNGEQFGGAGNQSDPSPFLVYLADTRIILEYTTVSGKKSVIQTFDPSASVVPIDITLDLTNDRFRENYTAPFAIGSLPQQAGGGGWGSVGFGNFPLRDVTYNALAVTLDGVTIRILGQRPATYAGGPSLPILMTTGSAGFWSRHMLVRHVSQNETTDAVHSVTLRDFTVRGHDGSAIINIGTCRGMNALNIRDLEMLGGTRAVNTTGAFVAYPVNVKSTLMQNQGDTGAFVLNGFVDFENVIVNSPGRRHFRFRGTGGAVRGATLNSPVNGSQNAIIEQVYGDMSYYNLSTDIEYPYTGIFLDLTPGSYNSPDEATHAELHNCDAPGGDIARVAPRPGGYDGDIIVSGYGPRPEQRRINGVVEPGPTFLRSF